MGFSKNVFEDKNLNDSKNTYSKKSLMLERNTKNLSIILKNTFTFLAENIENIKNNNNNKIEAAEIFSDTQITNDKNIIAEGNVLVIYKNIILKSDRLEFNREKRFLTINGNINVKSNDQFLEATNIEYDLKNNLGVIKNAYGSINFETLNNIKSKENSKPNLKEFQNQDKSIKKVKLHESSTIKFQDFGISDENDFIGGNLPQKLDADFNEMQNWRFKSNRIEIKDELWTAEKLFLTNDPFNKPQLIINNSGFRTFEDNGRILVKSDWSNIELDNFLTIPTGPRRYDLSEENNSLRWGIGYDEKAKDGLFINRNSDTIIIEKDKTTLDLKKVFFVQRALLGKTKSYSQKNDSVLGEKIEQDTKASDYIGLEAKLNSQLFDFDFYSNVELSSLDFEKLKKIISIDSELSKVLYEEKKENMSKTTIFSIFGNYRDKVSNGSLGEVEILSSYGTKIEKGKIWEDNKVKKSSKISFGLGYYQSGKFNDATQAIDRKRTNISLVRNHTYPIWEPVVDEFITNENKYSPYIIQPGIKFFVQTKVDFYRYDDNNFQNLYTLRGGPEFTFGNFKQKYFDYTKLRILPKTTIAKGHSPFEFDQANDKHGVEFILEQQIIGPITFKLSTEYNIDINSTKYKEFHKKKFEIAWNRRAYNLSAYYSEDNKTAGITFKINSFSFEGSGKSFK